MFANKLVLILLVACFAGLVLAASLDDQQGKNETIKDEECKLCTKTIDMIKSSGKPLGWKPTLEYLCALAGPKSQHCKESVDKYINDISTKTAHDFCKEMSLCS